ncbi:hypothetical protein CHS0354_022135 [Potamilus streckersoni]|uniref:Phospholipid/glycerol acyltransferase domain-containing protein n=1 Tax=Potamilus streckersoni TaxID=2493646 RepID=A0AAE0RTL9_9BIVA|nr:hypothetical protein CHS0354_022135 [Potamilus streckersoni]
MSVLEYAWVVIKELDIPYWQWVVWVFYPILISFLLPLVLLIFFYGSALFLQIYQYRYRLHEAYAHDVWDGARKSVAAVWFAQARVWHGYELIGLEKLPNQGPGLIIYYHGTLPVDFYYLTASCLIKKNRHIRAVGDKFLFSIPGWKLMMDVFRVTPGTVHSCIDVINRGHLLGIAPGGVREALFGDENYPIIWCRRTGFAKVAVQTNVPVYPVFTQNVREAFRTPAIGKKLLRKLYEKTRLPIVPIYGFFPVKLRTFIGDPVFPRKDETPDQFSDRVEAEIQQMIFKHQRLPGSILHALLDRFPWKQKTS